MANEKNKPAAKGKSARPAPRSEPPAQGKQTQAAIANSQPDILHSPFSVATFNVNSINMRRDATLAWLAKHRPTVLGLQEIKCVDTEFPREDFEKAGWRVETFGQKSYNGVALITSEPVKNVMRGFGDGVSDPQARMIAGEIRGVTVVNCYVPQGSEVGSDKYAYKLAWLARLRAWLDKHFKPSQPVVLVGDLNVAPEDIDCYAPDFLEGEVGISQPERDALEHVRLFGFTDVFRKFHADKPKQFSFFDYRLRDSFKYKKGWRIDHIWATPPLAAQAVSCDIDLTPRAEEKASDHTPVVGVFSL